MVDLDPSCSTESKLMNGINDLWTKILAKDRELALLKIENEKLRAELQYLKLEPLCSPAEMKGTWPDESGV